MCAFYVTLPLDRAEQIADTLRSLMRTLPVSAIDLGALSPDPDAAPSNKSGDVRPTDEAWVIRVGDDGVGPQLMRWGLPAKSLIINARAETLLDKPLFKRAAPCIIPARGYCEWHNEPVESAQMSLLDMPRETRKVRYLFTPSDDSPCLMAGVFVVRDGVPYYAVVTTAANDSVSWCHDRMPLILSADSAARYLCDKRTWAEVLGEVPISCVGVKA